MEIKIYKNTWGVTLTVWLVYKIGYFQRSGHAIAYNSSKSSQILKQCDKKTRSTKAEVTGMSNSLINSGRSEIYSLLAKIRRTFIRTEIVLVDRITADFGRIYVSFN